MRLSQVKKLLPPDIVKLYKIKFQRDSIAIYKPSYLAIDIKSIREIEIHYVTVEIKGKTFWVILFRNSPPYRHDCIW